MILFNIGYKMSQYESALNDVIGNDWWQSYEGQADEEIVDYLDKMIELWLEYYNKKELK
jgi:hypothetical protein